MGNEQPQYQSKIYLQYQFSKLKKSKREIANDNNVTPKTIRKWIRKYNITKEKPIYNNEIWLKNQYLILRKSIKRIAIESRANKSSIRKYLVKSNIPIRSRSEACRFAMDKINRINNNKVVKTQYRNYKINRINAENNVEYYG